MPESHANEGSPQGLPGIWEGMMINQFLVRQGDAKVSVPILDGGHGSIQDSRIYLIVARESPELVGDAGCSTTTIAHQETAHLTDRDAQNPGSLPLFEVFGLQFFQHGDTIGLFGTHSNDLFHGTLSFFMNKQYPSSMRVRSGHFYFA